MNPGLEPNLIIYGGSFDPPHMGHEQSVSHVKNRFPDAKILIMPGPVPAGAAGKHKAPDASFEHRVKMCQLAFEKLAEISTIEAELAPPNLTVNTLKHIKEQWPDKQLGLLIGQDQLINFPRWHQPTEILNMASLVVIKRQSQKVDYGSLSAEARKIAQIMDLNLRWNELGLIADIDSLKANIYLEDLNICAAESHIIRHNTLKKIPINDSWLNKKVLEYITANRLYSLDQTSE